MKDVVIDLLKYGVENIDKGVSSSEIKSHLTGLRHPIFFWKRKYRANKISIITNIYWDLNFIIPKDENGVKIGNQFYIRPEGYSQYLQHKSISIARLYSGIAIFIAILSILVSGFFSYLHYTDTRPKSIDNKQIEDIKTEISSLNQAVQTHSIINLEKDVSKIKTSLEMIEKQLKQ
jgi:hypothetical protein